MGDSFAMNKHVNEATSFISISISEQVWDATRTDCWYSEMGCGLQFSFTTEKKCNNSPLAAKKLHHNRCMKICSSHAFNEIKEPIFILFSVSFAQLQFMQLNRFSFASSLQHLCSAPKPQWICNRFCSPNNQIHVLELVFIVLHVVSFAMGFLLCISNLNISFDVRNLSSSFLRVSFEHVKVVKIRTFFQSNFNLNKRKNSN